MPLLQYEPCFLVECFFPRPLSRKDRLFASDPLNTSNWLSRSIDGFQGSEKPTNHLLDPVKPLRQTHLPHDLFLHQFHRTFFSLFSDQFYKIHSGRKLCYRKLFFCRVECTDTFPQLICEVNF